MNPIEQHRLVEFMRELERLSARYGVVVQSIGGVHVLEGPVEAVTYLKDPTSGDLLPLSTKPFGEHTRDWGA